MNFPKNSTSRLSFPFASNLLILVRTKVFDTLSQFLLVEQYLVYADEQLVRPVGIELDC